jgi:hypothetical protein
VSFSDTLTSKGSEFHMVYEKSLFQSTAKNFEMKQNKLGLLACHILKTNYS